jgi:hypothetical protein
MSIPPGFGEPIVVYPHECPGCLDRLLAPFLWILPWLLVFGAGVAAGYVLGAAG